MHTLTEGKFSAQQLDGNTLEHGRFSANDYL